MGINGQGSDGVSGQRPYKVGRCTHQGMVRQDNQDREGYFVLGQTGWELLIVCDGMGGHAGGQVASSLALETIENVFRQGIHGGTPPGQCLVEAVRAANGAVYERTLTDPELKGMGSTCVVLAVKDNQGYIAHVGDSRLYRIKIKSNRVERLTKDHSSVQRMVDGGLLTEEQAREHPDNNVLLRCIGGKSPVEPEVQGPIPIEKEDRLLLCTDGLNDLVTDDLIGAFVAKFPVQQAAEKLVTLANDRGGYDNVTIQILMRSDGLPPTDQFSPNLFKPKVKATPGQDPGRITAPFGTGGYRGQAGGGAGGGNTSRGARPNLLTRMFTDRGAFFLYGVICGFLVMGALQFKCPVMKARTAKRQQSSQGQSRVVAPATGSDTPAEPGSSPDGDSVQPSPAVRPGKLHGQGAPSGTGGGGAPAVTPGSGSVAPVREVDSRGADSKPSTQSDPGGADIEPQNAPAPAPSPASEVLPPQPEAQPKAKPAVTSINPNSREITIPQGRPDPPGDTPPNHPYQGDSESDSDSGLD